MLHVSNLTVNYPNEKIPALDSFSLDIEKNGLYLIAGKSGSGKSTFAKTILKLLSKSCTTSGSIVLHGQNFQNLDRNQLIRYVGFLPQFPMDYILNLLVRDEVSFPLENLGYTKKEIELALDEILQKLQISFLKNRLVTEISSGELQKVALATALISKPRILILDEPFARMDSNSELNLINLLRELKKETIIIILEHHLDYILEITDSVILLDQRKTIITGIPGDVLPFLLNDIPEISKITIPNKKNKFFSFSDLILDMETY